ncbi:MAG: low temperature requirement protein A, partial [Thermoplasmata archaeon]|nr:low temperature requirement protein A [Thermoplasmata archaeon]
RLSTLALMVPILGMAISAHDAFGEAADSFALSYVAYRVILIFMWWRAGHHNPEGRPVTDRYIFGFSISAVLWTGSVFVDHPATFYLWGVGLVIDLITPFTTFKAQEKLPKYSSTHLPERYGLFIIIVLGESVVALVLGASALETVDMAVMLTCTLGLVLAFGLWWLYFGHTSVRRKGFNAYWAALIIWMHFPLVIGLVALGAAINSVLSHGAHDVEDAALWLACGGLATGLFSLGVIRWAGEGWNRPTSVAIHFIGAAVALAIAALVGKVDAFTLLGLLAMLVWLMVIHRMWTDSKEVGGTPVAG